MFLYNHDKDFKEDALGCYNIKPDSFFHIWKQVYKSIRPIIQENHLLHYFPEFECDLIAKNQKITINEYFNALHDYYTDINVKPIKMETKRIPYSESDTYGFHRAALTCSLQRVGNVENVFNISNKHIEGLRLIKGKDNRIDNLLQLCESNMEKAINYVDDDTYFKYHKKLTKQLNEEIDELHNKFGEKRKIGA